jgi:hypothetical protein
MRIISPGKANGAMITKGEKTEGNVEVHRLWKMMWIPPTPPLHGNQTANPTRRRVAEHVRLYHLLAVQLCCVIEHLLRSEALVRHACVLSSSILTLFLERSRYHKDTCRKFGAIFKQSKVGARKSGSGRCCWKLDM